MPGLELAPLVHQPVGAGPRHPVEHLARGCRGRAPRSPAPAAGAADSCRSGRCRGRAAGRRRWYRRPRRSSSSSSLIRQHLAQPSQSASHSARVSSSSGKRRQNSGRERRLAVVRLARPIQLAAPGRGEPGLDLGERRPPPARAPSRSSRAAQADEIGVGRRRHAVRAGRAARSRRSASRSRSSRCRARGSGSTTRPAARRPATVARRASARRGAGRRRRRRARRSRPRPAPPRPRRAAARRSAPVATSGPSAASTMLRGSAAACRTCPPSPRRRRRRRCWPPRAPPPAARRRRRCRPDSGRCRRCRGAASTKAATSPGVGEARRHHHRHPVHVREPPQRHPLVGDRVLHAEDRLVGHAGRAQPLQRRRRVLGLHRQQDRVVRRRSRSRPGRPTQAKRARARRRPGSGAAARPLADRVELRAAGDADDLLPGQRQRRRHRAADRADAVDDHPHRRATAIRAVKPHAQSARDRSHRRRCGRSG